MVEQDVRADGVHVTGQVVENLGQHFLFPDLQKQGVRGGNISRGYNAYALLSLGLY